MSGLAWGPAVGGVQHWHTTPRWAASRSLLQQVMPPADKRSEPHAAAIPVLP